jgi:hypothetical protein
MMVPGIDCRFPQYRMSTKELYSFKMIQVRNAACLELHAHTSRQKNSHSFVSNDSGDCCCDPPLDVTSFENYYSTTEELVCSAFSEESVTAVQRAFRTQFHMEPPSPVSIHAWYKTFNQEGRICVTHSGPTSACGRDNYAHGFG